MKIFLRGNKYTGKAILEAFGKCLTALQNGSPDKKYELVHKAGDFLGMQIAPREVIQEKGAQLNPLVLHTMKKYIFFGPKVSGWLKGKDLRVELKPLSLEKEYDSVSILFLGVGRDEDGDDEIVALTPTQERCELYEKYQPAINKFLDAFGENLKG